jgi:hypothetical protein
MRLGQTYSRDVTNEFWRSRARIAIDKWGVLAQEAGTIANETERDRLLVLAGLKTGPGPGVPSTTQAGSLKDLGDKVSLGYRENADYYGDPEETRFVARFETQLGDFGSMVKKAIQIWGRAPEAKSSMWGPFIILGIVGTSIVLLSSGD